MTKSSQIIVAAVLIGAGMRAVWAQDVPSAPVVAARAAFEKFQTGDAEGLINLYHPESADGRLYARMKRDARVRYNTLIEFVSGTAQEITELLQLKTEFGEPVMEEDIAQVPIKLSSAVNPNYSYDFKMAMKLGPAPSGEGTTWLIWQDGMEGFFKSVEQTNADVATVITTKTEQMQDQLEERMEAEAKEKRVEAWKSPENCTRMYLMEVFAGSAPYANELLHPESAAKKELLDLEAKLAGAAIPQVFYVSSVCRTVSETLALVPEIGAPETENDLARVPVTLKSEKDPNLTVPFVMETKKGPEEHWCVWNAEKAIEAIEKAAEGNAELQKEIAAFRNRRTVQWKALGLEDESLTETVCTSPADAGKRLLEALAKGDIRAAETLNHPDSEHAKQFASLLDTGKKAPESLDRLIKAAGNLYKELFSILQISWEPAESGETAAGDEPVEVKLRLKSVIMPDWTPEVSIQVKRSTTESGAETWAVWESKLLDTLMAATEDHAAISKKVKELRDQVTAAEDELAKAGAATDDGAEAAAETVTAPESTPEPAPEPAPESKPAMEASPEPKPETAQPPAAAPASEG